MKKIAIIAFTEKGCLLGEKITKEYSDIDLLSIKKRDLWISNWNTLSSLVKENFQKYDGLIFIMAIGIVVRMISTEIKSKDSDPAIVVIDEEGNHTVSLLSGHLGGGNKLTEEISLFLDNNSVITTATDVNHIYALDSFAADYGLTIEPVKNIKKFNSALLNGKNINVLIDNGIKFSTDHKIKQFNFISLDDYDKDKTKITGKLTCVISNKLNISTPVDLYLRPKNIILGVGCKKEYSTDIFEEKLLSFLESNNISIKSVKEIRSISIKEKETCILDFSYKYDIPFITFSFEELNTIFERNPELKKSDFVFKNTGAYGVAEPSALFSKDSESTMNLIVEKNEIQGMTAAISTKDSFILSKIDLNWLKRRGNK